MNKTDEINSTGREDQATSPGLSCVTCKQSGGVLIMHTPRVGQLLGGWFSLTQAYLGGGG